MNQQQQNHHLRSDSAQSKPMGVGLNSFYWYQIFALDSAVQHKNCSAHIKAS